MTSPGSHLMHGCNTETHGTCDNRVKDIDPHCRGCVQTSGVMSQRLQQWVDVMSPRKYGAVRAKRHWR